MKIGRITNQQWGIIEDFFKAAKGAFGLGKIPQLHRQIHVQKHLFMLIINSNCRANRIQNKNTTTTTSRRKNRISTIQKRKTQKTRKTPKKTKKNLKPRQKQGNKN